MGAGKSKGTCWTQVNKNIDISSKMKVFMNGWCFIYLKLSLKLIMYTLNFLIIYNSKHRAAAFKVFSIAYTALKFSLSLDLPYFYLFKVYWMTTTSNHYLRLFFKKRCIQLTNKVLTLNLSKWHYRNNKWSLPTF